MRLIDVDAAIDQASASDEKVGSSVWETCEVVEFLDDCPIVDAVEVVRCKDCKDARKEMALDNREYFMCKHTETCHNGNHFCSYGERRTNENH